MKDVLTVIDCPTLNLFKKGKVRSVFDLGDKLLIVSSDRVSAFDYILPQGIPHKGRVLTQVSKFWFQKLANICPNHMISTDFADFPKETHPYKDQLDGRSMLVKKTELIEIECVIRGYLVGSGWKDYQKTGQVCGHSLPSGMQLAEQLKEPLFTPAVKASSGHDENISVKKMAELIGEDLTTHLQKTSLALYETARKYAEEKGIILADTKFEFGTLNGQVILIDEVFTPDSSRFWPKSSYQVGISPPSLDKQIVRDYLEDIGWDKQPPIPSLPESVIEKASDAYLEIESMLIGTPALNR